MKKMRHILIIAVISLILSILLVACASSDEPNKPSKSVSKPFPQHTAYTTGTIKPDHVSQTQLDDDVKRIYDAWKDRYLVQAENDSSQYYVFYNLEQMSEPEDAVSCSEGHGYGMLATALMAGYDDEAKDTFDGLYRFYKAHPSVVDSALMGWQQIKTNNGDVINTPPNDNGDGNYSATDGDMDIAYALLLADAQWGSDGDIDYLNEANAIIEAIMVYDVNTDEWILKLGNWANNKDSVYGTATRSSDFMLSHLRAFHLATGDSSWGKVADKTYAIMSNIYGEQSEKTGLLPDFIIKKGNMYIPANPNYLEASYDGDYYYNSCRVPWRVSMDYLLNGDLRALDQISTLNRWVQERTGGDPRNINTGYKLDGSKIDLEENNSMVFIAPFAVSAMADASNQEWLNTIWDYMASTPTDDVSYFDNSIRLLVMLTVSGNWWMP